MTTDTIDEAVIRQAWTGSRVQDISNLLHISRQRVRNIISAGRPPGPVHPDDWISPVLMSTIDEAVNHVCDALDGGRVLTLPALRDLMSTPQTVGTMAAVVEHGEVTGLLGVADPPPKIQYTDDDISGALQAAAATITGPLTGPQYDSLLKDGAISGPSRVLIIQRKGSWSAACTAAGIEHHSARREYHGHDRPTMWASLHTYAEHAILSNHAVTFAGYSQWAAERQGHMSGSSIKARMFNDISWNDIKDTLIIDTYRKMRDYWVAP